MKFRDSLTDDSQIIQVRFYTVIRASTYCDLEFMRQFDVMISHIKTMMDLLRDTKGIQQTILTGGSLTGHDRSHLRTGSSGGQSFFCDKLTECFYIFIRNALHLHSQSGGECQITVSKFFCGVCQASVLCHSHLSVHSDHTGGKVIRSLVIQKSQTLQALLFLFADG